MASFVVSLAMLGIADTFFPVQPPQSLVGYGCEGSDGKPVYHDKEDEFPSCEIIKENK